MLRAELESQRLKYEEIIKKKNEELAKKIEENCALQKTNAARTLVSEQAFVLVTALLKRLQKNGTFVDIPEALEDQIKWLIEEHQKEVAETSDPKQIQLLAYMLRQGPETFEKMMKQLDKKAARAQKELLKEVADTNVSIKKQKKKSAKVSQQIQDALKEIDKDPNGAADPIVDDLRDCLAGMDEPSPSEAPSSEESSSNTDKKKKTKGRQVVDDKKNGVVLTSHLEKSCNCKKCGSTHLLHVCGYEDFLRTMATASSDILKAGTIKTEVCHCSECGTTFVNRPADLPVPYSLSASCQTSGDLVAEATCFLASGLPMNRIEDYLDSERLQMATEALGRPTATWLNTGIGQILIQKHRDIAQKATHIGADETPMPVLKKDTPGEAYLFVRTSVPSAKEQFAIFDYIPSRSGEAISQALAGWSFDTINRDAYAGYKTAFKKLGIEQHVRSQVCLVHARRTFCEAFPDMEKLAENCELTDFIKRQIKEASPAVLTFAVLCCFSKIYRAEKNCTRNPDETDEDYFSRVQKVREETVSEELRKIDRLLNRVKDKYVQWNEKLHRWEAKLRDSKFANAMTFWLNNREDLDLFVKVPQLPADSNTVERTIRCVSLYKHSAFFKQSEGGATAFANALTLRETARLNGIKYPAKWLAAFHRAFYEHYETRMLTDRYAGLKKGPDGLPAPGEKLGLKAHQLTDFYYEDFDFTPWLAWNYVES